MLSKNKRYKNRDNLDLIKSLPCFVCNKGPTDPDHWRTRGSGGGDELSNLNALCRAHHTEKGAIGIKTFYNRYCDKIESSRERYGLPALKIHWDQSS